MGLKGGFTEISGGCYRQDLPVTLTYRQSYKKDHHPSGMQKNNGTTDERVLLCPAPCYGGGPWYGPG